MNLDSLKQQIDFIKEIDKVKYIQRKTKLFNSDRHENDAEHSWHLAMMVLVLAEHSNEPIDVLKVLKILLIHDIVEIDAGDTFLFDSITDHDNREEELVAAKRIFGLLPPAQADEFLAIWEEFEAEQTAESKFAKALDNLEPMLQNASNQGGTWAEFNVPYETIIEKKKKIGIGSETLWAYSKGLLDDCVEEGVLKK